MAASTRPVVVVGPQFCAPNSIDLIVTEKVFSVSGGGFSITDVNGNILFKLPNAPLGNPLLTFQEKMWSMHRRWKVFRGESTNSRDLLFSVKLSSIFQLKTKLNVFLAGNTKEEVCDFKVRGSYFDRSCTIYLGESNNIVAKMKRRYTVTNILLGRGTFGVTVYPHVDYAFIVALIVLLDEINNVSDG